MNFAQKIRQGFESLGSSSGSITIETAFMLPLLLFCGLGATELSMAYMDRNNAQQLAISYSGALSRKGGLITEKQIKEMLDRSGNNSNLDGFTNRGRVIMTSFVARAPGQTALKLWQRCTPQPSGRNFTSIFVGNEIALQSGVALAEGATYIAVEAFYDAQPLTGFYLNERDANGQRTKKLSYISTFASREDAFTAAVADPDAGAFVASSTCT